MRDSLFPSPAAPLSVAESRVYGELDALQELIETDALTKDELRAAAWVLIDRVQGLRTDVKRIEAARSTWQKEVGWYRDALIRCGEIAGEGGEAVEAVRSGAWTGDVREFAWRAVEQLREDYDRA